jgi:hypothetical protein
MAWTAPKTWNVGDPGTSADLNTYIRDNSSFLFGDAGWTNVSAFTNTWAAGGTAPGFILIGRVVYLRGTMTAGTANATAFTLPVGYRPSLADWFACTSTGTTSVEVNVTAGGAVVPGASVGVWLSNITFPVA